MHNKEGGYENDCSITRLAYNRFMLMSPSIQQMRSFTWVKHHLPDDGSVYLQVRRLLLFSSTDITHNSSFLCIFVLCSNSLSILFPTGRDIFVYNTLCNGTKISRSNGKLDWHRSKHLFAFHMQVSWNSVMYFECF